MNCKPGDLAVMVRSAAGNEGRLVHVEKFDGYYRFQNGYESHDVWICEGVGWNMPADSEGIQRVPDSFLRPLRDPGDDARDETLTWLPVPSRKSTPA